MKKVVHRVYMAWEFEEEEQWLNEMSDQGWGLVKVRPFRYEFEQEEPGQYVYRLEYMKHCLRHADSRKYIAFMQETGAELVGTLKKWVYFRRARTDGPFELFSDLDSRIEHLQRINALLKVLAPIELVVSAFNLIIGIFEAEPVNLWVSIPGFALGAVILRGMYRISGQIDRLSRERKIRE